MVVFTQYYNSNEQYILPCFIRKKRLNVHYDNSLLTAILFFFFFFFCFFFFFFSVAVKMAIFK